MTMIEELKALADEEEPSVYIHNSMDRREHTKEGGGNCPMTDDQIKHMANRFLGWKLPKPFNPDNFISFNPPEPINAGTPYENDLWPTGTNLFNATQAEAMVRFMIEGLPHPATLKGAE